MPKKIPTTVYLEPGQIEELKTLADIEGESMAEEIRRAVSDRLKRKRTLIPPKPDPRQLAIPGAA